MSPAEQRKAAQAFAHYWQEQEGSEKSQTQPFWLDLIARVFGVAHPQEFLDFEYKPIKSFRGYIDVYISSTHVLIEQKSKDIDLKSVLPQSDGTHLTPFEQAKRYNADLSYDLRARYIVLCNFNRFIIYDMNEPGAEPTLIELTNLEHDYYRLNFLVQDESSIPKEREDLSVQAGTMVSKLYKLLAAQYHDPESTKSQQSLNELCVRLVFCLYAEDAGLFQTKTASKITWASLSPSRCATPSSSSLRYSTRPKKSVTPMKGLTFWPSLTSMAACSKTLLRLFRNSPQRLPPCYAAKTLLLLGARLAPPSSAQYLRAP